MSDVIAPGPVASPRGWSRLVPVLLALAVLTLIVVWRPAWLPGSGTGFESCISFSGDRVVALAWSPVGDLLAVRSARRADGETRFRVLEWPSRRILTQVSGFFNGDAVAMDAAGTLWWLDWDPFSEEEMGTTVWRKALGEERVAVGLVQDGRFQDLFWAGGELLAWEHDLGPPSVNRFAVVSQESPSGPSVGRTEWTRQGFAAHVHPDARAAVWLDSPGGRPADLVVTDWVTERRFEVPVHSGAAPALLPDGTGVLVRRTDTDRLAVFDLARDVHRRVERPRPGVRRDLRPGCPRGGHPRSRPTVLLAGSAVRHLAGERTVRTTDSGGRARSSRRARQTG